MATEDAVAAIPQVVGEVPFRHPDRGSRRERAAAAVEARAQPYSELPNDAYRSNPRQVLGKALLRRLRGLADIHVGLPESCDAHVVLLQTASSSSIT